MKSAILICSLLFLLSPLASGQVDSTSKYKTNYKDLQEIEKCFQNISKSIEIFNSTINPTLAPTSTTTASTTPISTTKISTAAPVLEVSVVKHDETSAEKIILNEDDVSCSPCDRLIKLMNVAQDNVTAAITNMDDFDTTSIDDKLDLMQTVKGNVSIILKNSTFIKFSKKNDTFVNRSYKMAVKSEAQMKTLLAKYDGSVGRGATIAGGVIAGWFLLAVVAYVIMRERTKPTAV